MTMEFQSNFIQNTAEIWRETTIYWTDVDLQNNWKGDLPKNTFCALDQFIMKTR